MAPKTSVVGSRSPVQENGFPKRWSRMSHPLAEEFRKLAAEVREAGGDQIARVWELAADRVDEYEEKYGSELLTLDEAAAASGYHKDSISRMIAEEKIPNAGTKGAPRVRRRDLPRKPRSVPLSPSGPRLVEAALTDQGVLPAES